MAVRSFDGGTDELTHTVGTSLSGMTYGCVAAILQVASTDTGERTWFGLHDSGGTNRVQIYNQQDHIQWWNDDVAEVATFNNISADTWYLILLRKDSGTGSVYRSMFNFSTETWTHDFDSNFGDFLSPGSGGTVRMAYQTFSRFNGLIAVRGAWVNDVAFATSGTGNTAVENAGLETSLSAWIDAGVDSLWAYDQSTVNDDVDDLVGDAHQDSRNGTSVVTGDDPPGFDFTLGVIVEGTATADIGFTATATGSVTRFGVATADLGFTSTATGHVVRHGVASADVGFTATAFSATLVFGVATADLGFTATATGSVTRHGTATADLGGLTATAKSKITVIGVAEADLGGLLATAAGFRSTKPRFLLRGPTYDENLWTSDRFLIRYRLPRGITLAVDGTEVVELTYPYQEDLEQYDVVYLGGKDHRITAHEANVLIAAGYGDFITPL